MSLYPILAEFDPCFLLLSPSSLEQLVSSLTELVIAEKLTATFWIKPATSWIVKLEPHLFEGRINKIYWCQTFVGKDLNKTKKTQIVPIKLKITADLEREFFFLVISSDFSMLILAQQQPVSTMPTKLTRSPSVLQFKVFFSVDLEVIKKFLQGVRQKCDVSNSSWANFPSDLSLTTVNPVNANILLKLLLKQIEEKESLNIQLTSSDSPKFIFLQEQFIDQLSRELQAPLTNMKTAIRLLESQKTKPSQRQLYLDLLHKEWSRQNDLLTGLLDLVNLNYLSSLETSNNADIKEILPQIISIYKPIAEEKNIQLSYKIDPELPPVACCQLWVKKIVLNILNNNLKFTDQDGKVFIEARLTPQGVELSFSDTGVGINGNELNKIFDSFYQGKNFLGEENRGAGLGLTIVKQLLDSCEGSITVSSQVNKGSVFRVLFKIKDA